MSGFGKKSTAYICYLIVNIWWYLSCILGFIFPASLIYEYFYSSHPDSTFGITLPLEPSLVTLTEEANYDFSILIRLPVPSILISSCKAVPLPT